MTTRSNNRRRTLRYESLESRQVLTLAMPTAPLAGDYNANGVVDAADYAIWRDGLQSGAPLVNEIASPGAIDGADYTAWKNNFSNELDRIFLHDGSFIPRRAAESANSLIVPLGETFTLPADSSYDHIEVHGTLRVSRAYDTTLKFVDLIVFPGGELDMGIASDPVLRKVDFIVKDVPIDTDVDPWQLGNGIINLGAWHAYGRKLDHTWTTLANEMKAGDREIVLSDAPVGWQVGDELLIPDTAQIAGMVRRESTVRIAAIAGNKITLDKPLDFDHLAVRDPSGNVRLMPYVANATRNIVIRSENPSGTRGHTIQLEQSEADVRYVSFLGLGRTLATPLNSATVVDGVVTPGTNQVARYAWHWHHVHPDHELPDEHPHGGHLVGTFFDGTDIGKWGIVIHGTSDMHVADNVTDRFVGAGVITEDGNELRNVIERNFAMGSLSTAGVPLDSKFAILRKIPGGEGAGFWFHGSENTIRDNVAVNNNVGFVSLNLSPPPGVKIGTVPLEFSGNVGLSNLRHGIETWRTPLAFVVRESILANNGKTQFLFGGGEGGSITFRGSLLLAQGGVSTGISSDRAYTQRMEMYDSEVLGCNIGTMTFRSGHLIVNSTLQNRVNFYYTKARKSIIASAVFENVVSVGLPGLPFKHFEFGEFDPQSTYGYLNNNGYRILLKNWQLSGKNYLVYRPHSLPSVLSTAGAPEVGIPMSELWAKYGVAIDGGVVPVNAEARDDSEGYFVEFVGDTVPVAFPVSRLIVLGVRLQSRPTRLTFTVSYSGQPADANVNVEIDGVLVNLRGQKPITTSTSYLRLFNPGAWGSAGEHTVRTWRTLDGAMIEGSEMIFKYYINEELSA